MSDQVTKSAYRFKPGDTVYVRDKSAPKDGHHYDEGGRNKTPRGGYRIVEAIVQEVHSHPGRAPWYPRGEGYAFGYRGVGPEPAHEDSGLWWDCYPGCRVYATREEAIAARLPRDEQEARLLEARLLPR